MTLSNRLQNLILGAIGDLEASNELINAIQSGGGGSGTVTSIAISVPSFLSVSGSPVTSSGTIALSLGSAALPIANGGTNNASLRPVLGGIVYSDASKLNILSAGTSGQVLQSNGAATPSWVTPTASAPAGSNGNVQFNKSGAFGANSVFEWDNTNMRLGINQATPLGRIHANSATTSGTVGADAIILGAPNSTGNIGQGATILGGSAIANTASGQDSLATGSGSVASGSASHAEGFSTLASQPYAHAEGQITQAIASSAHAEGRLTVASQSAAHAEGASTSASGAASHAEGQSTVASGTYAHAEGASTSASGTASHAEGENTQATAASAHAEGSATIASGINSHAAGNTTVAQGFAQTVIGQFNAPQGNGVSYVSGDDAFQIGNGPNSGTLQNCFSVSNNGKARIQRTINSPAATQSLGAGFTITPTNTYCPVSSSGNVTSSASTVITAGSEIGQSIIIENTTAFSIILSAGGNAKIPQGLNFTLTQYSTISLLWDGSFWVTLNASANA